MSSSQQPWSGLLTSDKIKFNLPVPALVEAAIARGEGKLTKTGAFLTTTGKYTGRSPNDRFIVDEPSVKNDVNWGKVNVPFPADKFDALVNRVVDYLKDKELFVFEGFAGADKDYRLPVRLINDYAWQSIFGTQLFIRPEADELEGFEPGFTVLRACGFKCDPQRDGTNSEAAVIISLEKKLVLICGTEYAGETKKSIFSVMNYLLPKRNVLSMHCSANIGKQGDTALFFGLSGTGKTTLSADPDRFLIGDDEHGWSDNGVFNIEGGCYAKCISLDPEKEPQIYNAIKFGAVLENVVMDEKSQELDYDSKELTENTRAGYPVDFIPGAVIPSVGGHPKVVVFLTADAYGVLPPIAKLTKEQAMYHFLSGYTSKLAGTERGIVEPTPNFSTCFGAPFLPLNPSVYAELLGKKIVEHDAHVYLVNTGWSGGPYGVGKRMHLPYTRAMVTAAINGTLEKSSFTPDPLFGFLVPQSVAGVPDQVLQPRTTWGDPEAYDAKAQELAEKFVKNFEKFTGVSEAIKNAGPNI